MMTLLRKALYLVVHKDLMILCFVADRQKTFLKPIRLLLEQALEASNLVFQLEFRRGIV